jgi:hypothetical protein
VILGVVVLFIIIIAATSGGSKNPNVSSTATTASPSITTTPPPTPTTASVSEQLTAWWNQIKGGYQTVQNDMQAVSSEAKAGNVSAAGQDCSQLTTDVQSLQSEPPAPSPAVNTPWQAALIDLARGGEECSSGASQDDVALINQAGADFTSAGGEFTQATTAIP